MKRFGEVLNNMQSQIGITTDEPAAHIESGQWALEAIWQIKKRGYAVINDEWIQLPDDRLCSECAGLGSYSKVQDDGYGNVTQRWVKCTAELCAAAQYENRERAKLLLSKSGIGTHYADHSFKTWHKHVTGDLWRGKETAYAVASTMAKNLLQSVTVSQSLDGIKTSYERVTRDGIEYLATGKKLIPEASGYSLALSGDYGVGKTGLAVSMMHTLMQRGISVTAIKLTQFIRDIQQTYSPGYEGPSPYEIARDAQQVAVLIIDGFNVETNHQSASANRREVVFEYLVNPRYESAERKAFVITTNKGMDEFAEHWGNDIATRLWDSMIWLHVGGAPLRHKGIPVKEIVER